MGEEGDGAETSSAASTNISSAQFAGSEGKRGGEFYTPRSVVRVLVEMLEPYKGRVYDPCCGSGGMFVQSEKFVEEHGGRIGDIAIYGQETNYTTWRLCKMNLAVRGIDADIRWNNEGSFHKDELQGPARPITSSPIRRSTFPIGAASGCARMRAGNTARRRPATPTSPGCSISCITCRPTGTAGVVLANGSMSSTQNRRGRDPQGDGRGRDGAGVVDCMVALPGQLFYSTQIPACLWFLARDKRTALRASKLRDRRGEVLFIDARKLGHMVDRTRKEFSDDDISSGLRAPIMRGAAKRMPVPMRMCRGSARRRAGGNQRRMATC